jgi:hypothetical protein
VLLLLLLQMVLRQLWLAVMQLSIWLRLVLVLVIQCTLLIHAHGELWLLLLVHRQARLLLLLLVLLVHA